MDRFLLANQLVCFHSHPTFIHFWSTTARHAYTAIKMSSLVIAGLGIAVAAFAGRAIYASFREVSRRAASRGTPLFNASPYYRGGFEPKMTRRQAGLILGASPSAPAHKVREAHKRIMLLNHPDRGGSPYMAAKINEAKDYLESTKS